MSYKRNKQSSKNGKKREIANQSSKASTDIDKEPIWEFDEEHDVSTIVSQNLFETISKGSTVSMLNYHNLVSDTNSDVNKSEVVILITASLMSRLSMNNECSNILSLSQSAELTFKELKLDNPAINKMFTNMVSMVSPEIVKMIEMGMITSLANTSKKTSVKHTESRLVSAMSTMSLGDGVTKEDMGVAKLMTTNENLTRKEQANRLLSVIEDSEVIEPTESASNRTSDISAPLNQESLMQFVRNNKTATDKVDKFRNQFPTAKKSIQTVTKNDKMGLGSDASTVAKSKMAMNQKKLMSLEEDLSTAFQDHAENESESSSTAL